MTILLDRMPPDGMEALVVWVGGLGTETRANRPPGAVLPYYMITRPAVTDDKITESGTYRVHSFAGASGTTSALLAANDASYLAHRRVLVFGPPFAPQQSVTLSNGKVVQCDGVSTLLGPTREQYTEDNSIERFVADYKIDWRFVAVT